MMILILSLPLAFAGSDYLMVRADGGMPSACELELTYIHSSGDTDSCTVVGDDSTSDTDYECAISDEHIRGINDGYMDVQLTSASMWDCFLAGGVTLKQFHGDGDDKNYRTKRVRDDAAIYTTTECQEDFWSDASYPAGIIHHGKAHLAGANGFTTDDKILTGFRVDPSRSSDKGLLKDCHRETIDFCDIYDGETISLNSYHDTWLSAGGSSEDYAVEAVSSQGATEEWEVDCYSYVASLRSAHGLYLVSNDDSTVEQSEDQYLDAYWTLEYNNSSETWSLLSTDSEWLRAYSSGTVIQGPVKGNWGTWTVELQ